MRRSWRYILIFLMFPSFFALSNDRVLVFAASSMASALNQITQAYKQETGKEVRISYGGSSTLARQLQHGAPADIFISANQQWMNYAIDKQLIDKASHSPWLKNTLVLISGDRQSKEIKLKQEDILNALGKGRFAIAHPSHVPAGIYGKQALENLMLWPALKDKVAFSNSVRGTLALVERQEAPLGIVYFSDSKASSKVKILAKIPEELHEPIIFPKAKTKTAGKNADAFFLYLDSSTAQKILMENGFMFMTQKSVINENAL